MTDVRVTRVDFDAKKTEYRALLARVCLGMTNVRPNRRRGLVGTRAGCTDDRSIADVPDFTDLDDAWQLLNFFARLGNTDGERLLRHRFYLYARKCWENDTVKPYYVAIAIRSAAIRAVVEYQECGYC